jgi:hypothetical protein
LGHPFSDRGYYFRQGDVSTTLYQKWWDNAAWVSYEPIKKQSFLFTKRFQAPLAAIFPEIAHYLGPGSGILVFSGLRFVPQHFDNVRLLQNTSLILPKITCIKGCRFT